MIKKSNLDELSIIWLIAAMFLIAINAPQLKAQNIVSDKNNYLPTDEVVLSFSNVPPNSKNWIGIYKEGEMPGKINSTLWS